MPLAKAAEALEASPELVVFDNSADVPQQHDGRSIRRAWRASGLFEDFSVPVWPGIEDMGSKSKAGDQFGKKVAAAQSWAVLSYGGDQSGLPWHTHGATYMATVHGRSMT